MEPRGGTYALILRSRSKATAHVGRRGPIELAIGYYIYVGSAFGPGGVQARVARHTREEKRRHWHIDYLREFVSLVGVWYTHDRRHLEHTWAQSLSSVNGITSIPKFGCSDCSCHSHLFFASTRATLAALPGIGNGELRWMAF